MPELYLDPLISLRLDYTRIKIEGKGGLKTPTAVGQ
jgi:hypothetical protein